MLVSGYNYLSFSTSKADFWGRLQNQHYQTNSKGFMDQLSN